MQKKPSHSSFINRCVLIIFIGATGSTAGVRDPFPAGFSMSTTGAIIDTKGATGSQPWTGAALYDGTAQFGLSVAGVSYYASMGDAGIYKATGGAWYSGKKFICKTAIAYYSAVETYFEQRAFLSLGTGILPVARLSFEVSGTRMGCAGFSAAYSVAEAGATAFVPWSWAGISFSCEHLLIETANTEGADPLLTLRAGLHTIQSRFGSQGALVTVVPEEAGGVCFTIAEEYRLTPRIALGAALSNNPVLLSVGITFSLEQSNLGFALVNHSKLGWSQGFAADWHRENAGKKP